MPKIIASELGRKRIRKFAVSKQSKVKKCTEIDSGIQNKRSAFVMDINDDKKEKVIVAIDFGTTFTGIASAYSGTPDDIDVVNQWPDGNAYSSEKV